MKDVEIDMITDLVVSTLKNNNEVKKLKEEICKLINRNNYLENELTFARNMAIKKHNENKELTKTIEELKKDKEWFSDRLDEQIKSTLDLMNEKYSDKKERTLIFNGWKDDVITAKSIIDEFVGFIYVNVLFHDEILKMISSEMGEISIELLKEYIEKGKKFLSKDLPCYEDNE